MTLCICTFILEISSHGFMFECVCVCLARGGLMVCVCVFVCVLAGMFRHVCVRLWFLSPPKAAGGYFEKP